MHKSKANVSYTNYLVHSFGFSLEKSASISAHLSLQRKYKIYGKFVENANSVGTLFHNLGFDDTLIRNIVSKRPRLLFSKVDKTLKPKIRALQDADLSRSDIVRVISRHPSILWFGLESTVLPAIHTLKQVMGSVSNVVKVIERFGECHFRSIVRYLLPNITLLTSYGVPIEFIKKQLLYQPGYYVQNPEVFKNIVMMVENKFGITRGSPMFLHGINLMSGKNENTIKSNCRKFKSFGANQSLSNDLIYHCDFSHQQALSTSTTLTQEKKKVIDSKFVGNANSVVTSSQKHGFDSYATYLVRSLSFTHQQALSISNKLSLKRRNKVIDSKFVENANSVLTLFRNLGFHQTHIRNIVSKQPRLLTSYVHKTLTLKIRAFEDGDFSESDIIRVIARRPEILVYGLESTIVPTLHILKQVMGSVGNVVNAIERLNETYFRNIVKCLLPNVALLSDNYGVPIELIRKQLLYQPKYFVRNPEIFKDTVTRADKKLGIALHSPMNLYVINLMSEISEETFESKCQDKCFGAYQSFSNYLVNHLDFSHQQAVSTCTKLSQRRKMEVIDYKFIDNANSVVTLFHQLGFDNTLIRHIVSKHPRVLVSNVDETLKPKIKILQEEGFSGSHIIRVISRCPTILSLGMESNTSLAIQILRQIMDCNSNIIKTIERLGDIYFHNVEKCLLPNVALLTSYGVPIELIRKHILRKPKCFVRNPEVFQDIVMRVENKLGFTRDSPMFLYGINLISGRTEGNLESKFQIFKSFGWAQSDVARLMMGNSNCFTFSDEKIKKKLNFLMHELQLKPAYLTSRTSFIICSLEKRIMPRHKILLILKDKSLLKMNPSLYCAIQMSEPCFLKRFVLPFKKIHKAYAKFTGSRVDMLAKESAVSLS